MPRGAAGSRTSFSHHPVQDPEALFITRLLDELSLAAPDRVPDPDRLLRRIEPFELSFVMDKDFLEAARMKAANGPRAPIPDRREVPSIAEMATELRLAPLGLAPLVSELPVPEPLLAAELGARRVLGKSQGKELFHVRFELRLRPRLVDFFFGLLFGLLLLSLLLFRRLRLLLGLLFGLLLRLRGRWLFFLRPGLLHGPFLAECAEALAGIVDLSFLTQPVALG